MTRLVKIAALALAAGSMTMAAPASATIFEYEMTNGDVLTIDTFDLTGTWVGDDIDVFFAGTDLRDFEGGANPSFSGFLSALDGTRTINGADYRPTRYNNGRFHPWMLKANDNGSINLWSWWGEPSVVAGDYVQRVGNFRVVDPNAVDVPAPGMLGLFGVALVALGLGRRRRNKAVAA